MAEPSVDLRDRVIDLEKTTVSVMIEIEGEDCVVLRDVPASTPVIDVLRRHPAHLSGGLVHKTVAAVLNNTDIINLFEPVGAAPEEPVALGRPAAESAALAAAQLGPLPTAPPNTVVVRCLLANTYDSWCIMRRTLIWLVPFALSRVDPAFLTTVAIHHSSGRQIAYESTVPFTDDTRGTFARELREICARALPIRRETVAFADAARALSNHPDAAELLTSWQYAGRPVQIGRVGDADAGWVAPYNFPLAHSTAFCGTFTVRAEHLGRRLVIHLPRVTDFSAMPSNIREPSAALACAYDMGVSVADRLRATSLRALNALSPLAFDQLVRTAEIHMDADIRNIARQACMGLPPPRAPGEGATGPEPAPAPDAGAACTRRLIAIAGPSSSGKTTFSLRLGQHLEHFGRRPVPLSLDNYYKRVCDVPLQEDGQPDFETVEALRVDVLSEHLRKLLDGEAVRVPEVDFENATYHDDTGPVVQLGPRDVLVIEGIHALNPRIIEGIPRESVFKIFIAPLTAIRVDSFTRLSTSDMRLIRRMSRDARTRGASATDTLRFWPSVRHGEAVHIYPWSETADVAFNSATCFELAVLKPAAVALLETVPPGHRDYHVVQRLQTVLGWVATRAGDAVPPHSIIREFLGGGVFDVK